MRCEIVAVLVLLLTGVGCSAPRGQQPREQLTPSGTGDAILQPIPYAQARWRLASPYALQNSVAWVSHILIRHGGSDRRVPGTVFPWRLEAPPPDRTRADALALANPIALEAAQYPERFAELARKYSEDSTTSTLGGSLGGVRGSDFMRDPEILDVLAALRPGEVSRVVETEHGFQILYRRPPPPLGRVSGVHIVIGHEDALWLSTVGAAAPQRTRSEALALATRIYEEALGNPEGFLDLVRRYSEHPDKVVGGDIGTWSLHEPTPHSRAVERLNQLRVGEIAAPLESYLGVEILQRTIDAPRKLYAMEAIKLGFAPRDPTSKKTTLERAARIAQDLEEDPSRFDEFRRRYCCPDPERWFAGRDEPGLTAAVDALMPNQISPVAVSQYVHVVIPRRINPERVPAPPDTLFELPAPEKADVMWHLTSFTSFWKKEIVATVARSREILAISQEDHDALEALAAKLTARTRPRENELSARQFLERVDQFLGPETARRLTRLLEARIEEVVLSEEHRASPIGALEQ